ncbi:hypothetical protein [Eisenbergiella sp.]|nr:hypothetical protein [Eisenbergiella sp.]
MKLSAARWGINRILQHNGKRNDYRITFARELRENCPNKENAEL